MKKNLLFKTITVITCMFACFVFTGTVHAQNSIPNGNFETWDSAVYQSPIYYPYTANGQSFFSTFTGAANVTQATPGYHGSYAVQLTTTATNGDTSGGFLLNTNPNNGNPTTWTGGIPYTQSPAGIRGYYKSNIMPGDSGLVIVAFTKGGVNIGAYIFTLGGTHAAYTLFDFTFSPALSTAPDSVILGFTSSDLIINNGVAGSTVTIDSVSFTGVGSQPTDMNGDFELWQTQTLFKPGSWIYDGDQNGDGMQRTTDAHSGNYALELTTYNSGGNNSNKQQANSGSVSTGSYPNNCDSNCAELGGYPFANQVDTLSFYYKYAPQDGDSAVVELNFKKNGSQIWGNAIFLPAAGSYQHIEFPFDIGSAPDSVIINLQSSNYNDTTLADVGSDLKIDDIYFKSQINTGVKEFANNAQIALYPNPFNTYATLEVSPQTDLHGVQLRIYDVLGRTVKMMAVTENKTTIQKDNLSSGVYFYEVINDSQILKTGKLVIE